MKFQIKEARMKAGLSQKELAKIIGVAPSTFNGYESGNHDPKSDLLIEIAKACDVTVDFLLGHNAEIAKKEAPLYSSEAEEQLIALHRELNQEGQEKLLDYADDLVASGKYIKSNPNKPGMAKDA